MSKMILIAAATLVGGIAKGGELKPFQLAAGSELTDEIAAKLGLDKDDVAQLIERGTVVEAEVREAGDGVTDTADLEQQLAAANARADAAEDKVKDLEKQLADAKPAKSAGGAQA